MIYDNILETIGRTPLVRLQHLVDETSAEVLVKVEAVNPGGSIKDRPALSMILAAEAEGILSPGGTIIEPTSGNMGIALAMVAAARGYRAILVMPETMSEERKALMGAFGAELLLTPGEEGMQGAVNRAAQEAETNGYFMPYQFENFANSEAHAESTAAEILEDTENRLDSFVAGVGTGGTVSGTGAELKRHLSAVEIVAVEPLSSPLLSGGAAGSHAIQGIGANFIPGIYRKDVVDRVIPVSDEDALRTAREMAKREGILCGISSGANVFAALETARRLGPGKRVVTVLPDTGERYLSTNLFRKEEKP